MGGSIFLIAVGAILYWAVHYHVEGINLPTVGLILMVVGALGLLFSAVNSTTWRRRVP
jgi:hypothetical protein